MQTRSRFQIYRAVKADRIFSLISAALIGIAALAGLRLASPQALIKEQEPLQDNVSISQAVDNSFVEAALKDLGPYVRRGE